MSLRTAAVGLAITVAALFTPAVEAGIVIGATRVIYPERANEVTVKLSNTETEASEARLVEAWIDNGEADAAPEQMDVPFLLTPPVFRLDAGKSQLLRIVHAREEGQMLPEDKESVFWLNVLAVPPKTAAVADGNTLRFAYRTRIKLFFRPAAISGNADQASKALQWRVLSEGSQYILEVRNASAYHVTFSSVALMLDGVQAESGKPPMLAPGASVRLPLQSWPGQAGAKAEVRFETIGDDGDTVVHDVAL